MENKILVKKILLGLLILLVSIGTVFGFRYTKQVQRSHFTSVPAAQTAQSNSASAQTAKVRGPDSAPIRILDFSDFQCPACAAAVPILDALIEKY